MSSSDSESSTSSTVSKKLKTSVDEEQEVTLSATSKLWSWKVMVPSRPSSPIPIPSTSMEETPTVGKPPKLNFLERYLKEIEHEHKVDTETPVTETPVTETPDKETPDVDNPPVPPTISMDWATFVNSRTKKQDPKILVMKFPNLMMRLATILAMLDRPDVVMDSLFVPPELDNPWIRPLMVTQEKKVHRQETSKTYSVFHDTYKGFLFLENIQRFKSMLICQRHASVIPEAEFERFQPWMIAHPHFCPACSVIHPQCNMNHPQNCLLIHTNGPRSIDDLSKDSIWRTAAKAVCIGRDGLFYQPSGLKHTIINISSTTNYDYLVPASADQLFNAPKLQDKSLIHRILSVVRLIGTHNYMPIFVEFYENENYPAADISLHIAGFAQAIRHCQEQYSGPIIILFAPVTTRMFDTPDIYHQKKDRLAIAQKYGHLIGQALGVPIIHITAQITEYTENGLGLFYSHWYHEPLVTSAGTVTREYYNRISYWMERFVGRIYDNIPRVAGPE